MTKSRREATLDVLVQLEDAFELNDIGVLDITSHSEAMFEHEGWQMTMKLTARKITNQEGH